MSTASLRADGSLPVLLRAAGLGLAAFAFAACAAPRPADLSATLKDAAADVAPTDSVTSLVQNGDDGMGGDHADRLHRDSPWEVLLTGGGASNEDFDAGNFQFNGSVGYFVTEALEVALRQGATFADGGEGVSADYNGQTRVAVDYHFPIDCFWPFIGANFGGLYGDSIDETLAAGPEVGFKWFLKEEAFLYAQVEYVFLFDSEDEIGNAFEDGVFLYNLGFGLRF